jgi:tRNA dimethylallyltransferase
MKASAEIPVVVVLGPTAVGKTEIAIKLAEELGSEIVSVDSRLLYRGMDIGTAKPTPTQRKRVPHHLIDVADPKSPWSMAKYVSVAKEVLREIHVRGILPILVGGTGQYVTALLEGWSPPGRAADKEFRDRLESIAEKQGSQELHNRLREIDPTAADRIDHRNVRRVVRALEIHQATGLLPSEARKQKPSGLRDLRVGLHLPREELYARIDARIDAMIEAGLVEEVRSLMTRGLTAEDSAMSAIGYRQILHYLQGEASEEDAVQEIRRVTRQLVRRQANWFKMDDVRIHWFLANPGVEEEIVALIRSWRESLDEDISPQDK